MCEHSSGATVERHELESVAQAIESDPGSNQLRSVQQLRDSQQKYAVTGQTQQAQALAGNESDQCVVPRTISNVRNAIFGSYNQLNVYEVVHKQGSSRAT
jgi:hypothetical protein